MDSPAGVIVKLALVALIWGGSFIAGRITALEMSAPTAALWRYLVATIMLVAILLLRERGWPRLSSWQWIGVVLLGLTGVVAYNLCFIYGLATVQASRGSLILSLNPAATMIGAALLLHEPLTLTKAGGIGLAFLGVAVELSGGNPLALLRGGAGAGEIAIFGCAISWSAYTLVARRITVNVSPLAITTYAALVGTVMLAIVSFAHGDLGIPKASFAAWTSLAYMGSFGTAVAFVWFLEGVQRLGPARAAVFINLVPVAAIALGALLLDEPITVPTIVGAAMVITGVWILNRPTPLVSARAPNPS
ncbi:MAG TPA: DMT family transporter [Casimicrobiaceae bacterium]